MHSMLNLLTLALRDLKKNGQSELFVSDCNLRFLQKFQSLTLSNMNMNEKSSTLTKEGPKKTAQVPVNDDENVSFPENPPVMLPNVDKISQYNWLKNRVLNCPVCNQHVRPGKKVVFGVGNLDADIFFCGEAPGADEEIQGIPFVGRAGQLLTKIILAMGLTRDQVYIGNIMNWRPELNSTSGNRPPTQEEMNFCLPYLKAQLEIVQPKVIVALGATAVNGLFGYDPSRRMKDIRGNWIKFGNTPCMVTFHPSYLLRNNTLKTKRVVWEDMLQVMEKTNLPISEKQRNFFL